MPAEGIRRLACSLLALAGVVAGAAEPAAWLREFPRTHAVLDTPRGCVFLDLYVAESAAQRQQGLMYIRELGAFEGMIFQASRPVQQVMWMRNTYLPLDMLFLDTHGRVSGVHANAQPLSEEYIRSPGPAAAVVELNGGFAASYRVKNGNRLTLLP